MQKSKTRDPLNIVTLAFRSTMRAPTLRNLIEEALLKDPVLNECFITGVDPSLFRIQGMNQHGDIQVSHCKFADPVGIRISIRHRLGDQALADRLVAALGLDVEPVKPAGKGSGYPFEDRSVGHALLDVSRLRDVRGLVILPSAVESGLDCLWDDEKEIVEELRLIAHTYDILIQGSDAPREKHRRVVQLQQQYKPLMTVWHAGRRLPLVYQAHLPSEDGNSVLRIHFAEEPRTHAFIIGWVDEYSTHP